MMLRGTRTYLLMFLSSAVLITSASGAAAADATASATTPSGASSSAAGSLAVVPPAGRISAATDVVSSAPCVGGDHFHIFITGKRLDPDDNIITGNTPLTGLPRTSDHLLYAPLSATFSNFFGDHGVPDPKGTYRVTLRCHGAIDLTSQGDFIADISFDGAGHYQALGDAARRAPSPDGGGLLGGNAADAPTAAPAVATTPGAGDAHKVNGLLVVGVPALLVVLTALALFVRRRSPRADARPTATLQQRKVTQ
jgi:hypothetical protein